MAPRTRQRAVFHPLPVAAVERLTDDSVTVTFDVPGDLADEYRFTPGQHVTLRCALAGDDVRRNYSICAPATTGPLRVAVKRLPGGVFSTFALERLRAGDTIEVMTPSGSFTVPLDPAQTKHYCAMAAGSGITPVLSILATALEVERESRATLVYGNRTSRSIMFLEELADLKDRYLERFCVLHVLSRERQEAELLNGRIDAVKLKALFDTVLPPDTVDEWFLCGPAEMIETARDALTDRGVDPTNVHRELFHIGPAPPRRPTEPGPEAAPGPGVRGGPEEAGTAEVTILLDGRASTFALAPSGTSVLDAALAVRSDAPYACKNGMCGTCRAKVVEGDVTMDHNYALEDSELAAGFVLACQAHPAAERVTLDFDA